MRWDATLQRANQDPIEQRRLPSSTSIASFAWVKWLIMQRVRRSILAFVIRTPRSSVSIESADDHDFDTAAPAEQPPPLAAASVRWPNRRFLIASHPRSGDKPT
jgi:hypothetical protein